MSSNLGSSENSDPWVSLKVYQTTEKLRPLDVSKTLSGHLKKQLRPLDVSNSVRPLKNSDPGCLENSIRPLKNSDPGCLENSIRPANNFGVYKGIRQLRRVLDSRLPELLEHTSQFVNKVH